MEWKKKMSHQMSNCKWMRKKKSKLAFCSNNEFHMNINLHSSYSFAIMKYSIPKLIPFWMNMSNAHHLLFHNVCSLFFICCIHFRSHGLYVYPYGSIFVNNYQRDSEIVSQVNIGIWTKISYMTFWYCCE